MLDRLMDKAREYLPEASLGIVKEAYDYAEEAHRGQFRKSGEPFLEHPVETALALADLKLDADALAAGLLHDVVEDSPEIVVEDIEGKFGADVARLVDGVTKFTAAELAAGGVAVGPQAARAQAETIRKMLMAMAQDIRVVLIKLADRLHNMSTIKHLPPAKRIEKSRETLDIYAPLAHRLGIWEMKWRLEDMSFQQLYPAEYREISQRLNAKRVEREEYVGNVRRILERDLVGSGLQAEVFGRPKHIYSIYNKISKYANENKTADNIYDLFALRVLVDSVADCYAALGVIHSRWHPVPGEFDDYIANPKDNLYQSIHTTVIAEDGHPVEIQVRTREMHQTGGVWRGGALAVQGRRRQQRPVRAQHGLAAADSGVAAGRGGGGGFRRVAEDGHLPEPSVRLYAGGRVEGASVRLDTAGLRVPHPLGPDLPLHRGEGEPEAGSSDVSTPERRHLPYSDF